MKFFIKYSKCYEHGISVYVSAEPCGDTQDCVTHGITQCGGSTHVICHSHRCECLATGGGGGGSVTLFL